MPINDVLPARILILNIDGLRQDVFHAALRRKRLPNLARIVKRWVHLDPFCPFPSVTFCSQSTIYTGLQPSQHGVTGNQFFDRFGGGSNSTPRFYAFDIGDTLAVDDALRVFCGSVGLLGELLPQETPTLYEVAARYGLSSLTAYHMLGRGATTWIKPNLMDIARFTKGGGLLGLNAGRYDDLMVSGLIKALRANALPYIINAYFMGLDHHSHEHGPSVQPDYLVEIVDRQIGRLTAEMENMGLLQNTLLVVVSDHGQVEVTRDDCHSLRMSFPFDREMGYLFDALHLDVHDKPGEAPHCDAVVGCNGGMAHIYLRNRLGEWRETPRFVEDVLPVAQAFWEANLTGRYAGDLLNALVMILVRDVEHEGWQAPYRVFTPQGLYIPSQYLLQHAEIEMVGADQQLCALTSPQSGDLLLVSNYVDGYYFGAPASGMHGGLHPGDSKAVLSLSWVRASRRQMDHLRAVASGVVADRRLSEGRDFASLSDLFAVLVEVLGWSM